MAMTDRPAPPVALEEDQADVSMDGEPGVPAVLAVLVGGLCGVVTAVWWFLS